MTDYMKLAERVARSSDCQRKQTGAVIVREGVARHIQGFNHLPDGTEEGFCNNCPREGKQSGQWNGECPVIHAEKAVILKAAQFGFQTDWATMYCTYKPCLDCSIMIVEAGICKVIYRDEHNVEDGVNYLRKCGVEVEQYEQDALIIDNPDEGAIE